jgi:hypothetical protein
VESHYGINELAIGRSSVCADSIGVRNPLNRKATTVSKKIRVACCFQPIHQPAVIAKLIVHFRSCIEEQATSFRYDKRLAELRK